MLEQAGFTVSETTLYGGSRQTAEERDEVFTFYCSIVAVLVLVAGLMSGLTLGLMSLDTLDLEVCSLCPSDLVHLLSLDLPAVEFLNRLLQPSLFTS